MEVRRFDLHADNSLVTIAFSLLELQVCVFKVRVIEPPEANGRFARPFSSMERQSAVGWS